MPQAEGLLKAQGENLAEPKATLEATMTRSVQGGIEGEKAEKEASKIVNTPAQLANNDKDRPAIPTAQGLQQSVRSAKKAGPLRVAGVDNGGTLALSGALALDAPSEGKFSTGGTSPSIHQHKEAEAMATSPVKDKNGAVSTPIPYRAGHPAQGPLKSLAGTESDAHAFMISQRSMTGGAASQVGQSQEGCPSWRKQDSTSLEDKAMDVLPDLYYNSFEEELRKEGQRLRKGPGSALSEASETLPQPLAEGEQAATAEDHQEGE